ncbi:Lrp/AsnC ligand binding domain-containing protein [Desulfobacterales bacterium HSG16]|nr:Lrp/AsnC ligand binding domain-containing protein [Desulfobacterales bacterium HSG16]
MNLFSKDYWKKKQENKRLKSFSEHQKTEEAFDTREIGLKDVELNKIVGSVGRYLDFDSRFRPRTGLPPERMTRIRKAMLEGTSLPPILLYRIKDEYYILDGNHRVSVAKQLRRESINARIIEFLPSNKTIKNVLYREQIEFVEKTGLTDPIELTEVGQYSCLIEQIEEHEKSLAAVSGTETSFKDAATDWNETIYLPFRDILERSHLSEAFPKRTLADLYVYVSLHQWKKGRKREFGIGLDQIIPKNMEEFRAKMAEKKGFDFPEMKRLITAFVMISVKVGEEYKIMDKLFAIDEVREIYDVPGDFDLFVKIVMERDWLSSDSEVIGALVYKKIRRIPGVRRTSTLIPIISKRK